MDGHRELYNAALQERRDAWRQARTRIGYGDQSAQLTRDPGAAPGSGGVVVLQPAGHAAPAQPGVRRFLPAGESRAEARAIRGSKATARFDSVEWPKDGDGARWLPDTRRVYLQRCRAR